MDGGEGPMTTPESIKATHASLARDLRSAARHHLGSRRALLVLAMIAIAAGVALNWSWLVAAGIAPVLVATLPCLVMCGLGLCMNKLIGGSSASQQTGAPTVESPVSTQVGAPSESLLAGLSSCCGPAASHQPTAQKTKTQ